MISVIVFSRVAIHRDALSDGILARTRTRMRTGPGMRGGGGTLSCGGKSDARRFENFRSLQLERRKLYQEARQLSCREKTSRSPEVCEPRHATNRNPIIHGPPSLPARAYLSARHKTELFFAFFLPRESRTIFTLRLLALVSTIVLTYVSTRADFN